MENRLRHRESATADGRDPGPPTSPSERSSRPCAAVGTQRGDSREAIRSRKEALPGIPRVDTKAAFLRGYTLPPGIHPEVLPLPAGVDGLMSAGRLIARWPCP